MIVSTGLIVVYIVRRNASTNGQSSSRKRGGDGGGSGSITPSPLSPIIPTNNPNNPDTPDPDDDSEFQDLLHLLTDKLFPFLEKILTNPEVYKQIGEQIAVKELIKTIAKSIVYMTRIGVRATFQYAFIKAGSFVSRTVLALAERFGSATLARLGIKLTPQFVKDLAAKSELYAIEGTADDAAVRAGEEAAMALVKSTSGLSVSEAAAAIAGPLGMAFDVIMGAGFILDMWDPAGYNNVSENSVMIQLKEEVDKQFAEKLKAANVPFPPIMGPFETSDKDQIKKNWAAIADCSKKIIHSICLQPIFLESLARNMQKYSGFAQNDANMQAFFAEHIDPELMYKYCTEQKCTAMGGIMVRSGICSWKDYDSCLKSNDSVPNDQKTFYFQWDPKNNECTSVLPTIKMQCEDKNTDYDPHTGLCHITKEYCDKKGMDYIVDQSGIPDCHVSTGQGIAEDIFGKTITRTFKKLGEGENPFK